MTRETMTKIIEKFNQPFDDLSDLFDENTTRKKKENDIMDLANIKVMVGNKTYTPNNVDWIQTPYAYPKLKLDVTISPQDLTNLTHHSSQPSDISIKNVIFNPPATIVFWSDNTKTVVKAECERYDPEKGLAMAISKKMLGDNKYEYYNTFLHWLKKWNKEHLSVDDYFAPGEWDGDMCNI